MHLSILGISLSIFLALFDARAAGLVSQTVGQVADHVITSREVQICAVIESILYSSAGGGSKALAEVKVGEPEFKKAVTATLLEVVVSLEAKNFNVGAVNEAELDAAVAKVEKAVSGKAYWNGLEVSSAELKKFVERKLESKSFLKFKTSSMSGIITDQEAQAYYDKNRAKFGSTPFAGFKENIRTFLAQQQLEERLRSWFEVIKRKYKVRNFQME